MEKRVNIISLEIRDYEDKVVQQGGIVMRMRKSKAEEYVKSGAYKYTTKNKLKSFLIKNAKLTRNEKTLQKFDMAAGNSMKNDYVRSGHKILARVREAVVNIKGFRYRKGPQYIIAQFEPRKYKQPLLLNRETGLVK